MTVLVAFLSLLIELAFGYPNRLFERIGHPVTWIGALIDFLDRKMNRQTEKPRQQRLLGILAAALIVIIPVMAAFVIQRVFGATVLGLLATGAVGSSLVAQRSLASHVKAVAEGLDRDGIASGRLAVSQIVGRDPDVLDEAGVCRAAIESLAENFSDGVVAPALWLAIGGLPAGVAYKAINTADSMIGHKTPRHLNFGCAAARLDDLVNLPASRLCALTIVLAALVVPGTNAREACRSVLRDARKHRSPNAGWPEAAMAGALGLALAGPRAYGGVVVPDAVMGEGGRREATADDIRRALRLFWIADGILVALVGTVAALLAILA
jgi:adenosylcobinamide-phosphate synthase